jgi:hypothetical protein
MKLCEIAQTAPLVVRVDQDFSDLTFDFPLGDSWDDISEVLEPLKPLVYVITPIDQDYRGMSGGDLGDLYANSPELAYFVGTKTGNLYQQDLLNVPHVVYVVMIEPRRLMDLVLAHSVTAGGTTAH